MDIATLKKEAQALHILEKELKSLQKQNDLLFKNMHKFSKQQFEEEGEMLSKKIEAAAEKLKSAYNNLFEKLKHLQEE